MAPPPFINKILEPVVTFVPPSTANRHLRRLLLEPRPSRVVVHQNYAAWPCRLIIQRLSRPKRAMPSLFLSVKVGMTVIVKHLPEIGLPDQPECWWMADVIFVEGGARNPKVPTFFQVADVVWALSVGLRPIW